MKIITAIDEDYSIENNQNAKIFLAGGINNCPDWQSDIISKLKADTAIADKPVTFYNPRRANFPIHDPNASEQQIAWEFQHLRDANAILFWFAKGSLNPIVLYELGRWGNSSNIPIIIGCDPEYERKQDVIIQTALSRPEVHVWDDFDKMTDSLIDLVENL